jgi:5-enolpyruvylshikimate-3-phosphate synthase
MNGHSIKKIIKKKSENAVKIRIDISSIFLASAVWVFTLTQQKVTKKCGKVQKNTKKKI